MNAARTPNEVLEGIETVTRCMVQKKTQAAVWMAEIPNLPVRLYLTEVANDRPPRHRAPKEAIVLQPDL